MSDAKILNIVVDVREGFANSPDVSVVIDRQAYGEGFEPVSTEYWNDEEISGRGVRPVIWRVRHYPLDFVSFCVFFADDTFRASKGQIDGAGRDMEHGMVNGWSSRPAQFNQTGITEPVIECAVTADPRGRGGVMYALPIRRVMELFEQFNVPYLIKIDETRGEPVPTIEMNPAYLKSWYVDGEVAASYDEAKRGKVYLHTFTAEGVDEQTAREFVRKAHTGDNYLYIKELSHVREI